MAIVRPDYHGLVEQVGGRGGASLDGQRAAVGGGGNAFRQRVVRIGERAELEAERAFIAIGWLEGQLRVYLELGPLCVFLATDSLEENLQVAQHMVSQARGFAEKISVLNTRLQARNFDARSTDLERSIKRVERTLNRLLKKRRTRS